MKNVNPRIIPNLTAECDVTGGGNVQVVWDQPKSPRIMVLPIMQSWQDARKVSVTTHDWGGVQGRDSSALFLPQLHSRLKPGLAGVEGQDSHVFKGRLQYVHVGGAGKVGRWPRLIKPPV
ncbi:maestro heat-like repeat-containing protein family member 7-like [Platysternon megacephalum]|uniref:Maestro heat-like repeat-containing protein family member 7-like n=1 Tax=Platysternon megacephalum TaxID=55544 RepID=A0A4D9DRY9_9SAUR|nr:maestro heat-like repeat-containing protein family member 7-like [Platysternon megacephalum]